jgi:hypothetical protein
MLNTKKNGHWRWFQEVRIRSSQAYPNFIAGKYVTVKSK